MIRLTQERNRFLLAVHGWSGTLLGLLLYAVILTGMVSVFAHEIGDWSAPLKSEPQETLPHRVDAAIRGGAAQIDPSFLETVLIFQETGGRLHAFFHRDEKDADGQPVDRGVAFNFDPVTLQVLERHEGLGPDIADQERAGSLSEFFVNLHVRLHLPNPWGLLLTGCLGLAMMVAAITGFVIHRHLIRELFTLRRRRGALLKARDTHVIAGTWNLLFAFLLAFTGSFFSFASAFGIPAIAMVAFGGDQDKLIETVVGGNRPVNTAPAPAADLDAMLADARARSGSEISFVSISHYGRADARLSVTPAPRAGALTANNFLYDGDTGRLEMEKPNFGHVPSFGNSMAGVMGPLHFGNFGGVVSRSVWFALGLAAGYVALTGMLLWSARRAEGSRAWSRFATAVHWMGYGLPMSLAAAPIGYFTAVAMGADTHNGTGAAFLAAAALATLLALLLPRERLRRILLGLAGASLLLAPALRLVAGGAGWGALLDAGLTNVISMDVAVLLGGALLLRSGLVAPKAVAEPAADEDFDDEEASAA